MHTLETFAGADNLRSSAMGQAAFLVRVHRPRGGQEGGDGRDLRPLPRRALPCRQGRPKQWPASYTRITPLA